MPYWVQSARLEKEPWALAGARAGTLELNAGQGRVAVEPIVEPQQVLPVVRVLLEYWEAAAHAALAHVRVWEG